MRVISFSADGIKNAAEKGFYDWLKEQDADFVCIQDLRCSEYDLQDNLFFPEEYNPYFFDDIDGKANGVAIYCRQLPKAIMTGLGFADFDMEGRYIQADYENRARMTFMSSWVITYKRCVTSAVSSSSVATGMSPTHLPTFRTPSATARFPASSPRSANG